MTPRERTGAWPNGIAGGGSQRTMLLPWWHSPSAKDADSTFGLNVLRKISSSGRLNWERFLSSPATYFMMTGGYAQLSLVFEQQMIFPKLDDSDLFMARVKGVRMLVT